MKEQVNKEQVREDLEMMASNLVEATNKIKKVYEKIMEIYEEVKPENKQEVSKY